MGAAGVPHLPGGRRLCALQRTKKEITALAVDAAGNIYAAGTGEKRAAQPGTPTATVPPATAQRERHLQERPSRA